MYVTYLGYRIERRSRNRVDIRDHTGRLVQRKPRWTEALEWIEATSNKEKTHDLATGAATAHAHFG
jgi:hypothetical protein